MAEFARRSFIAGLGAALIVAPVIVRAGSLMPVKQMVWVDDDIASLLDARLDGFEGQHDQRIFKRYVGYDAVEFDPEAWRWRTQAEVSEAARRRGHVELFELQNAWWKDHDPAEYQRLLKTRLNG